MALAVGMPRMAMAAGDRLGVLTYKFVPGTRVNLIIRFTKDLHCHKFGAMADSRCVVTTCGT